VSLRGGVGGNAGQVNVKLYDRSGTDTNEFEDDDIIEELEVLPGENKDQRVYGPGRRGMLRFHYGLYAVFTGSNGELTYTLG